MNIIEQIKSLSPKSQRDAFTILGKREFARCAETPIYWLDASAHPSSIPYVFTKDNHLLFSCRECGMEVMPAKRGYHLEHTHGLIVHRLAELEQQYTELPAIRPFPHLLLKEYMEPIVEEWLKAQYFVLEKSRDMMATWLFVALHTWDVLFHKGRQHLFQSQTAPKTLEIVMRANLIYRNHPKFLRDIIGPVSFGKGDHRSGEMFILDQQSEILGFAQGPDQIRQFHPSGVFTDESAFQVQAEEGFATIKPAIQQGGRYTGISSANRSWFEKICRDRTDEN